MSSLYRCKARVAYRPYGSDKLIVFEERQIQELSVKLKWQPNLAFSNADQATPASVFTNALTDSTCSVTISDPYLTGLAWPALFDAAALYTASTHAAANNILLPACKKGQDPNVDKCFYFADIDGTDAMGSSGTAKFAHLLLSLWYDVKGTSFGTDFYFRLDGISISHGTKYPSVTLRGVEAKSVLFNQSLVNMSFPEGTTIEEAVKDLAEKQGYETSFCANTSEDGGSPRNNVLNRSIRLKGATPDEILKKLVNSTGGNILTQPIRDYANRISICTRGEVNQGCSVFYLGKGLYEGYEITAQPDISLLAQNMESGGNFNDSDPYVSQSFSSDKYVIDDIAPNKRKAALDKVKKLSFPGLFSSCAPRCKGWPTSSGYVWKGTGPNVNNEKVQDTVMYGLAPNGTTAISFFKGTVEEAGKDSGRVVIKTDFFLRMCESAGKKKCFSRPILQESSNLSEVKVKVQDKVESSQEVGKSTSDKKEFTRFYIKGHGNEFVVLDPQLVWKYAVPVEELRDTEKPATNPQVTQNQAGDQSNAGAVVVGRVGSTGESTGPHLHAELGPFTQAGGRGQPVTAADIDPYVLIDGAPASAWGVYSPYGPRTGGFHYGIDFSGPGPGGKSVNGQPVSVTGGATVVEAKSNYGGYGNAVIIRRPDGKEIILAHLQDDSIPPNIAGLSSSSGGGKVRPTIQGSGGTKGAMVETGFRGVPRALRIIPGRTILSFVTEYDDWIEGGRKSNAPDPGVWIPRRFKNWFVNECEYKWRDGDLRVQLEGVSQWGTGMTQVPLFSKYLESMRATGEVKMSSSYYDYIRSLGTLSWKTDDGKDSTEVFCKEAQELSKFLSEGTESSGSPDVSGSFPTANCQNPSSPAQNAVMGALRSAGINTQNAYAGVLGNIQEESGFDPNVHNTPRQGLTCLSVSGAREKCYGLVQWGGSRKVAALSKCGQTSSLQCQLEFMVQEIGARGGGMVEELNNAKSPAEAAVIWARKYEVSDIAFDSRRVRNANAIFPQLKCDRST